MCYLGHWSRAKLIHCGRGFGHTTVKMFYKFNRTASRIQTSEGAVNVQAAAGKAGEVTHIPAYKASPGSNVGIFDVANRVASQQSLFKGHSELPVFLRGRGDVMMYKGIMIFSVIGIGLTFYSLFNMATGRIQKK